MTAAALPPVLADSADARRLTTAQRKRNALRDGVLHFADPAEEKYFIPCDPVYRADLGVTPHLAYLRKSSEDQQKQTLSLKAQRQHAEATAQRALPLTWWESFSGTTFDGRPAFLSLLAFCKANPQPPHATGTIWAWDYDRFSRQQLIVDGKKKPNAKAMLRMLLEFDEAGWRWHFIKTPPMGYELGDMIIGLVKFEQAGQYSSNNSENVQRNKDIKALDETEGGFWLGGVAPYPAARMDYVTKRVMQQGEWTQPEHGVVLVRDDAQYPYWVMAAELAIDGWSPQRIADRLTEVGAPLGPTMVDWTRQSVVRMLTNTTLVSQPTYQKHKGPGTPYEARWEPVVDPDLFWAAKQALEDRRVAAAHGGARKSIRPLDLTCPNCEAVFIQRVAASGRRTYVHPHKKAAGKSAEWRDQVAASGCRAIVLDAEEVEQHVWTLIERERLSEHWKAHMKAEWARQQARETVTINAASNARARYEQAKRDVEQLMANLALLTPDLVADFQKMLVEKKGVMQQRKHEWQDALKASEQSDAGWESVEQRIDEMTQRTKAWAAADLYDRRKLFRMWVEQLDVRAVALPAIGARRASRYKGDRTGKELAVFLRTQPEQHFTLPLDNTLGRKRLSEDGKSTVRDQTSGSRSAECQLTTLANSCFVLHLANGYLRRATA